MKLLREPIVHFAILGALLFAASSWRQAAGDGGRTVVIGAADQDWLAASFEERWGRPPTFRELAALVEELAVEKMLHREALALGLDREDPAIRRLLADRMALLATGSAGEREPTESEVRAWYDEAPGIWERPFEEVRDEVAANLLDARAAEARRELVESLREKYDVRVEPHPGRRPPATADPGADGAETDSR